MKKAIFAFLIVLLITSSLFADESIIFAGLPTIKISEGGVSRTPESITKQKTVQFKCTITKIDDKYYWASRENVASYFKRSIHYLLGGKWLWIYSRDKT